MNGRADDSTGIFFILFTRLVHFHGNETGTRRTGSEARELRESFSLLHKRTNEKPKRVLKHKGDEESVVNFIYNI